VKSICRKIDALGFESVSKIICFKSFFFNGKNVYLKTNSGRWCGGRRAGSGPAPAATSAPRQADGTGTVGTVTFCLGGTGIVGNVTFCLTENVRTVTFCSSGTGTVIQLRTVAKIGTVIYYGSDFCFLTLFRTIRTWSVLKSMVCKRHLLKPGRYKLWCNFEHIFDKLSSKLLENYISLPET
jgi:hypothetical protein